jgi:hypothetical protein
MKTYTIRTISKEKRAEMFVDNPTDLITECACGKTFTGVELIKGDTSFNGCWGTKDEIFYPDEVESYEEETPVSLEQAVAEAAMWREKAEKLEKALEIYERERARYRHSKPEITGAYFLTGGYGEKDGNMLPEFVEIVPAYGCGWSQVYQRTDRTISYEGS